MISRRQALGAASALLASAGFSRAFAQDLPPGPGLAPPAFDDDPSLITALKSPLRSDANRARDIWRHPLQSLDFWGLAPGLTVIDLDPGGGYWTEILAPYLFQGGGHYLAGLPDPNDPSLSEGTRKYRENFAAKYGGAGPYGPVGFDVFTAKTGLIAPAASADMILYCRFVHNLMWVPGALDQAMGQFFATLVPGGVLAIEEHRADPRAMVPDAKDGYVAQAFVIAAAEKAGFTLAAQSEINANPKDSKDHPFGVWTLPPTRRSSPIGQPPDPSFNHAKYDAVGESDRMTLRFVKPAVA